MKPQKYCLNLVVAATVCTSSLVAEDGWKDLCSGQDLSGWVQRGGMARYTIEDGTITGTSILNTPNSFLCTEERYGDFILEYDFTIDRRLNSGVQFRSECFDVQKNVEWKGQLISIPAGRVHGYQIEIDPDLSRKRMWSGGIYDEGRRKWLFPGDGPDGPVAKAFSQQGLLIFRPDDWNHVRVQAVGDSIKTWLNGTPCANLKDAMTLKGFIALQVHGIHNDKSREGAQVHWRNLRIKPVSKPAALNVLTDEEKRAGWQLLWNGKSTDGWRSAKAETFPHDGWEIKDGILCLLADNRAEARGGGDIITKDRYADFELLVDFKITLGANSGIKYFVQSNLDPLTNPGTKSYTGSAVGLEFQILDNERRANANAGPAENCTIGSLYDLIRVSIGHSDGTPNHIRDAIKAGASLSTHLGNGCADVLPRHPNHIWEQLAADELMASLIVDGHHLPPATVKSIIRAKTVSRTILVTDAVAAAGGPPGTYELGGRQVTLTAEGQVRDSIGGGLAGAALTLNEAVANTTKFTGLAIDEALKMASTQPAEFMGMETRGRVLAEWDAATWRLRIIQVKD